jgi:hypothetical protein
MNTFKSLAAAALVSISPAIANAASVTVDNFTSFQTVSSNSTNTPQSDTLADASVWGGNRYIESITLESGASSLNNNVTVVSGIGAISNDVTVKGKNTLSYAGGPADLTDGATNTGIAIFIDSLDGSFDFSLILTDGSANTNTITQTITANGFYAFLFSGFTGVDATDVSSFMVEITSNTSGSDMAFDFIEASDLTPPAVPLPAGGVLLGSILLGGAFVAKRRKKS